MQLNYREQELRNRAQSTSPRPAPSKVAALRESLEESDRARKALLGQIENLRKDKQELKKVIEQKNEAIKSLLIRANPVEVALTLPLTWEQGDILPEELVKARLEEAIAAYDEHERDAARKSAERSPQFYARKLLAQDKAWEYAQSQGWINESSYRTNTGKFIVLRHIEQAMDTSEQAINLAREFELPTDFGEPGYMWDRLCDKRISSEMVLALHGDDRGWGEGAYFLCLGYCHQEVDEAWFPDIPYCGVF